MDEFKFIMVLLLGYALLVFCINMISFLSVPVKMGFSFALAVLLVWLIYKDDNEE